MSRKEKPITDTERLDLLLGHAVYSYSWEADVNNGMSFRTIKIPGVQISFGFSKPETRGRPALDAAVRANRRIMAAHA